MPTTSCGEAVSLSSVSQLHQEMEYFSKRNVCGSSIDSPANIAMDEEERHLHLLWSLIVREALA